jgi:hypothetical protein
VARYPLIDAYIGDLAKGLPTSIVDELADGLIETWEQHMADGLSSADAERAAIDDFGTVACIRKEFVAQAPGRRTARMLLATGPIMAASWGMSLVTAKVWTWPIATPLVVAYGVTLIGTVAALVFAGTSTRSFRRTQIGKVGAFILAGLDGAMIVAVATAAPMLVWPMAVAIPASLVRIGLAFRSLPARRPA